MLLSRVWCNFEQERLETDYQALLQEKRFFWNICQPLTIPNKEFVYLIKHHAKNASCALKVRGYRTLLADCNGIMEPLNVQVRISRIVIKRSIDCRCFNVQGYKDSINAISSSGMIVVDLKIQKWKAIYLFWAELVLRFLSEQSFNSYSYVALCNIVDLLLLPRKRLRNVKSTNVSGLKLAVRYLYWRSQNG